MRFHQGIELQRGRGFGSIIYANSKSGYKCRKTCSSKWLCKNLSAKSLDVGKEMLKNIATDVLEGQTLKNSAKTEINKAKKKISKVIKGSGKDCKKRKCKVLMLNGRKKLKFNLLNE